VLVKSWDVIVVGGGIIGLSLAIELRKRGAAVLLVERGEPGRESSHAAAGMLADCPSEMPLALAPLAAASARIYPEFVHELQDESGMNVDLRDQGTIVLGHEDGRQAGHGRNGSLPAPLSELEPALAKIESAVTYRQERSVDPRALSAAAVKAAHHRGVDISSGTQVLEISIAGGSIAGVGTDRTHYHAPAVVNCAGAWAGQISPHKLPTRPVKGQMLALVGGPAIRHVIRSPEVYLVPRSDGRTLIGATVEEAGYDKRTDPTTIQRLHQAALKLVPALGQARVHEAWAGLRPGTPDNLPILGETAISGYFVAAGHFRDGILLAPATARAMAQLVTGSQADYDLSGFSALRFGD
jgi:glycine oxidase